MNLIMFCYNFMRTKNILGFEKMMQAIRNWSPDYNKVPGFIKTTVIRSIYSLNKQPGFEGSYALPFIRVA